MGGPWQDIDNPDNGATIISAVFSCFLSLLVVVTFLLFKRLQSKLFMKLITLISVCDLIANASQLNGLPTTRPFCVLQGVVQQFFYPASWLWTAVMTYLLYSLVVDGKISLSEWKMHLIVWGICTAITILPFTTSTYGHQEGIIYWCWVMPSKRDTGGKAASNFWNLCFDIVVYICIILMTFWGFLIFYKLRIQQIRASQTVRTAVRTLFVYPIVLFITWFPNAFLASCFPNVSQTSDIWLAIECLSIWQGGLTAIIFFRNSRESRILWHHFFLLHCGLPCCLLFNRNSEIASRVTETRLTLTLEELANDTREDFESDDAYYGRSDEEEQRKSARDSTTQSQPPSADIALTYFNNPIRRE
jgi:hypothetical protein